MSAGRGGPRGRGGSRALRILGFAALAVLGFGAGIGVGVLFEEPSLVVDYALGETQSVEWGAGPVEDPLAPPDVAEPPPLGASRPAVAASPPPAPAVEPAPAPTPEPALPPVAAAKPKLRPAPVAAPPPPRPAKAAPAVVKDGFAIQVGAFAESVAAERLASELRTRGHRVYVTASGAGRDQRWRVRVGPIATREAADRTASRLRNDEKLPTWVLREDAG